MEANFFKLPHGKGFCYVCGPYILSVQWMPENVCAAGGREMKRVPLQAVMTPEEVVRVFMRHTRSAEIVAFDEDNKKVRPESGEGWQSAADLREFLAILQKRAVRYA